MGRMGGKVKEGSIPKWDKNIRINNKLQINRTGLQNCSTREFGVGVQDYSVEGNRRRKVKTWKAQRGRYQSKEGIWKRNSLTWTKDQFLGRSVEWWGKQKFNPFKLKWVPQKQTRRFAWDKEHKFKSKCWWMGSNLTSKQ